MKKCFECGVAIKATKWVRKEDRNNLRFCHECGCIKYQCEERVTHKMSDTRFYRKWGSMKYRAKNVSKYAHVDVCERWQSFENFNEDMYVSYQEHLDEHGEKQTTLDRIDSLGNYEPSNCRWATHYQQCRNKRDNNFLTHESKTMILTDWARELGVNHQLLSKRLKLGWSVEKTLTLPSRNSANDYVKSLEEKI